MIVQVCLRPSSRGASSTRMRSFTQAVKLGVPTGDFAEAQQIASTDPRDTVRAVLLLCELFAWKLSLIRMSGICACLSIDSLL